MPEEVKEVVKENAPRIEVVFLGKRWFEKDRKTGYSFISLEKLEKLIADGKDSRSIEYASSCFINPKVKPNATIGGIMSMECEVNDEGRLTTVYMGTLKWERPGPGYEFASIWRTQDRIVDQMRQEKSMRTKFEKGSRLNQCVDHLSWIYRNLPANQRQAFLFTLMNDIMKGGL
ncbi:hypothetical protein AU106_gp153 [Sinorhizobium phage phiM9]|uniref:Uncharacterized protein n=1 Tax=Sinorhizobium phage phiM9 TaxID=1636182 RepID=A0A0F6TH84_9CAUD|nr:hypothetical protein AU106_gp153 [Sinorhizobium phage phiM9]AKE44784.1 hypothetical protein Sm_phiM9_156 [Sinorhizobium phage phiM9]